ncbi:efflux RND transporter permease subunit [candidate division WOR-3 bacterium]|nr:efflux RND transporter permease subunit [candidate division WOR-3 bacterium]
MTKIAIKRPVLTAVIFTVIVIFGGISLSRLPVDFLPDATWPQITVITPYIGAAAEDVEKNLSEPLEEAFANVPDIKEIRSQSQEGVSILYVKFEFGKSLDEAANEMRDRIDIIKNSFPEGAEDPVLFKFNTSQIPIVEYAVISSDPRIDLGQLLDNKLINELKRASGVGDVTAVHGSAKREITVTIDQVRFERSALSLDGIATSLAASNVNFPVGDVKQGRMSYTLRVPAEFNTVEEIRQVPVGFAGTQVVRLGDIAEVKENLYEQSIALRANGTEGSFLILQKRSGANTVQTARNIEKIVEQIEEAYPDLSFTTVFNSADIITTAINNLLRTLLIAFVLVVLVSFLLLGNSSAGWITSITIPVSLIAAFIYLYLSGGSINIISLSSLAITIGMVVDNGIVVLENIFRQREKGREAKSAAEWGVKEVVQAVMASTLTTVAIFIPFLLVKGFIGIYFKELAFSVPIILFASLATAVTLTPMLASRFLRMSRKKTRKGKTPILQWIPKGLDKLARWYRGILDWSLSHRWVIIVTAIGLFVGGMGLFAVIPTSFMSGGASPFIRGQLELPGGTRFEVTDSIITYIETEIRANYDEEVEDVLVMGGDYSGQMGDETGSEAKAEIFLTLADKLRRSEDDIAQDINQRFSNLAGLKRLYFTPMHGGPTGGQKAISLEIFGYDIPTTDSLAKFFADSLGEIPGFVGIVISRESTNPELWLEIDKERAYTYGLTPAQVGLHLRNATLGKVATEVAFEGDKLEVVLRFQGAEDWTQLDFESMTIPTPMGGVVPLSNLARFVPHEGPASIERKEGERLVKVETDLYELPLGSAIKEIQKIIDGIDFPFGTRAEISGQAEDQRESFQSLFFALIVGIVLVFLVMAAQFENFREPFIVLFAIPFAMTGVAIALAIGGSSLDIMAFVGMVLLVGVVVNNAIVLIDYINLLRRRGLSVREAILDGGERRLRPVLMTTLTTVFGLAPLAFIPTKGSEMWAPLGVAVIGGLLFSTVVTLILVPVIYSGFERAAERRRLKKQGKVLEGDL